jgi:hypothetical protein
MNKLVKIVLSFVVILSFSQFFKSTSHAQTFPDVDPTSEVGMAVEKLFTLGIVKGKPDGNYAPKDTISRAEAARIMYGVLELEDYANETGQKKYPDVPLNHWAYKEISTISDWEVMNGYNTGNFGPADTLTRGQMAHILRKALDLPDGPASLPFTDVTKNAYYYEGVASLYAANITKGKSATTFDPNGFVTREELALFLDRSGVLNDLLEKNGLDGEDFELIDIAKVDGQILNEVRFRQLLDENKQDIWSIYQPNFNDIAYFEEKTMTFENLSPGESIFEVNFHSIETPVYLKLYIDENDSVSYQFMTPKMLKSKAKSLSGTAELSGIISKLLDEHSTIDIEHLHHYVFIENDSSTNFYSYLDEGIFYFEFSNTTPFTMIYDFDNGETGEILISPYKKDGIFNYTAKIIY